MLLEGGGDTVENLRPLVRAGRVRFAGPLLEGGAPVGSLVVFEAPDLAAARAIPTSAPSYGERTSIHSPVSAHSPPISSLRSVAVVAMAGV